MKVLSCLSFGQSENKLLLWYFNESWHLVPMGNIFRCSYMVQELDYPILKNNLETYKQLNARLVYARSYSGIAFQNSKLKINSRHVV